MRSRKRSTMCAALERALLARDRREMASVERLMKIFRVETRAPRVAPRRRHGR